MSKIPSPTVVRRIEILSGSYTSKHTHLVIQIIQFKSRGLYQPIPLTYHTHNLFFQLPSLSLERFKSSSGICLEQVWCCCEVAFGSMKTIEMESSSGVVVFWCVWIRDPGGTNTGFNQQFSLNFGKVALLGPHFPIPKSCLTFVIMSLFAPTSNVMFPLDYTKSSDARLTRDIFLPL